MLTSRYLLLVGVIMCLADDVYPRNTGYRLTLSCSRGEKCVSPKRCSGLKRNRFGSITNKRCNYYPKMYCCRMKSHPPRPPQPPSTSEYPIIPPPYPPGNKPSPHIVTTTNRPTITQQPELVNVCGKSKVSQKKSIFPGDGGVTLNAQVGDWPWMAALFFKNRTNKKTSFNCGGSLISNRWVLTAAHCFTVSEEMHIYFVRLGVVKKNYYQHYVVEPTDVEVHNYIIHPQFDTSIKKINDIALVHLVYAVPFTDSIRPICLPPSRPHGTLDYYQQQPMIVTGWGALQNNGTLSCDLKTMSLKVIGSEKCAAEYSKSDKYFTPNLIGEKTICAGEGTSTACRGDSGGPLMYYDTFTDRFYLEGIISFSDDCKETVPAVFMRIAYHEYRGWIEKNANEIFPAPQ